MLVLGRQNHRIDVVKLPSDGRPVLLRLDAAPPSMAKHVTERPRRGRLDRRSAEMAAAPRQVSRAGRLIQGTKDLHVYAEAVHLISIAT